MDLDDLQRDNQANWNDRATVHRTSKTYDLARYVEDPTHLSDVVTFDAPLLGDISGLDVVHLQCHIGTDTVSLARLGARVIGVDFSETAIETAQGLAGAIGADATFVVANVYDAATAVGRTVDLVYTGIGAINWIQDLDRWAGAIAGLLRPGGRFYIREMHPALWTFEEVDGAVVPHYETLGPSGGQITFDTNETYTDGDHDLIVHTRTHEWHHSFSQILNALIGAGLTITRLEEFAGLPWPHVPSAVLVGDEWFLPESLRNKVPQTFSLWAERRAD